MSRETLFNTTRCTVTNKKEQLNESIVNVNKSLQEINAGNLDTEMFSKMWANYSKNAEFNLEATGQKRDPI